MAYDLLIPPKKTSKRPGAFRWPRSVVLASPRVADHLPLGQLADDLQRRLNVRTRVEGNAFGPCCLRIHRQPQDKPERYQIAISSSLIEITAGTDAGSYYAVQTLREMLAVHSRLLPCCRIDDWPDFARRGVYHDVSRGKVPTVATLKALVERLGRWKLNELSLFVDGVFEFQRHPAIGAGFSRLTAGDILELQEHCKLHHVRLVGSMASFAHMGPVLNLPQYRHLGERYSARYPERGSWVLCPTDPGSARLMEELYEEFVPLFEAEDFHVCGDEVELGQFRSKSAVRRRGQGGVYLDFMLKLRGLCHKHGKRMNAWGDMVLHYPELFDKLPKDVVLYNWDFFKGGNYMRRTDEFARSGLPLVVCPSACAFQTHGARLLRSMRSISAFAEEGRKHGAIGLLCTDWGDYGHLNPLGVSLHGFAYSGAVAWNGLAVEEAPFTELFCYHTFGVKGPRMAKLMRFLGNTYHTVEGGDDNVLFMAWRTPLLPKEGLGANLYKTISAGCREVIRRLVDPRVWPEASKGMDRFEALAMEEFALASRMDAMGARKAELGRALLGGQAAPAGQLRAFAADMDGLAREFKRLWLARNMPSHLRENLDLFARTAQEARAVARTKRQTRKPLLRIGSGRT